MTDSDVALISCDPYAGEIQADTCFGLAEKTNVTAIVFYTQTADYCNLTGFTGSYPWIYTTKSRVETTQLLNSVNSPDPNPDGQVYASIGTLDSAQAANGTAGGANAGAANNSNNSNPLGPSPSTAVAMIILYSITGIITALFLVIIITGAVRAHRHPERYGPRNVSGRPRQSRARGLGRAIVDTLPIVKFGERQEPKPGDVELADGAGNTQQTSNDQEVAAADGADAGTQQRQAEQPTETRDSVEGGIAAAVNADQARTGADKPENQGCSICTEDFEAGQDQRVLPCDHRFHPECIDPWLLNVSGTCPLCRIDLRPTTSNTDENALDENGNPALREGEPGDLAPPLEAASQPQRMSIRRSLMIGLLGARGADRLTQEERLEAVRQLRRDHLAAIQRRQESGAAEAEETQQSRRARLSRLFGIRTRRTGQTEEPPQEDGEAESGARNQESSSG